MLIVFFLFGCVTKQKVVDIVKQELSAQARTEERESSEIAVTSSESVSGLTAYDFSQIAGKWALDYDGDVSDGFRFFVNQTEKGWEAGAEGKGKATASREETQTQSRLEVNWQTKFDSLANSSSERFREYESRIKSLEKEKTVTKKSVGLQAGAYITGTLVLVVVILLIWLGWRVRNAERSVRAFLNFKNLLKDD